MHCQIGAFRSKRRGEATARKDKNGRVTRKDEVKSTFLEGRQAGGTSSEESAIGRGEESAIGRGEKGQEKHK